ncbi:MAG: DUF167 domain-containing protein [Coriobacteriales bacterium]|nr:DUF167 domain-containing protein [Coriobacteriales bacterium]
MSTLAVKVTPKAGVDAIIGWNDSTPPELVVKVRTAAEGGKANAALLSLIARQCSLPRSRVRLLRGETSRHKLVEVDMDEEALRLLMGHMTDQRRF